MTKKAPFGFLFAFPLLASPSFLHAQSWNAGPGDFRVAANWTPAILPGSGDTAIIANGGTATIADGPFLEIGRLLMGGDGSGAANLTGNLTVSGGVTSFSSTLDEHSIVGNTAANLATAQVSVLSMTGGEIQVDDPAGILSGKVGFSSKFDFDQSGTNFWESSGQFNNDLIIGEEGMGRLELHGNSKLLLGDDLKLANSGSGTGQEATLIMDGTSLLALGSGAEAGKLNAVVSIALSDDAVLAAGNSLGPGNPAGQTDEGYLTLGTRDSSKQSVTVGDRAELQCMTLQNRLGSNEINLTGEGKLMIHNVFTGSGTILATRPSFLAGDSPCDTTVTLRDSSIMTVDCLLGTFEAAGSNGVNGLHLGGGDGLQGGSTTDPATFKGSAGGTAILDIGDSARLEIKQGLHLGVGDAASSNATLRITGPDATVTIGGNLNLAYNEYMGASEPAEGLRPGTGRLEYVLTGNGIKPIAVTGAARLSNGTLKLVLDGFTPPLGTRYTLLRAKSIDGPFKDFDVSEAPLPAGQFWDIASTGTSVTATVNDPSGVGPILQIETDEDSATLTWTGGQLQVSPDLSTPFVDVEDATSPYVTPLDIKRKFYRVRFQ